MTKITVVIWYKGGVVLNDKSDSFFLIEVRTAHTDVNITLGQACGMFVDKKQLVPQLLCCCKCDFLWSYKITVNLSVYLDKNH